MSPGKRGERSTRTAHPPETPQAAAPMGGLEFQLPAHEELLTSIGPVLVPRNHAERPDSDPGGIHGPGAVAVLHVLLPRGGGAVLAGAETGYLALYAGHLVGDDGHVLALEAEPESFSLLGENLRRHTMSHVRAVPAIAGWSAMNETFKSKPPWEATIVDLDDLLHPGARINVVAMKARQLGHRAIGGLGFTIVRWRPTLILEFSPATIEQAGDAPGDVLRTLREFGYSVQALHDPRLADDPPESALLALARGSSTGCITLIFRPVGSAPPDLYHACRERLIRDTLSDAELVEQMTGRRPLPAGYGFGFDERVVELPWIAAQEVGGVCLDAGSALNHDAILEQLLPRVESLTVFTLTPEEEAYAPGVSYERGDLRATPFEDGAFDTVVCVSTLDHVGMDNTGYGDMTPRAPDPGVEVRRAVREMRRIVAPGGRILITVPFGEPQDLGWMRQINDAELDEIVALLRPATVETTVFAYGQDGWKISDRESARTSEYRDVLSEPADRAVGARAVACIRAEVPATDPLAGTAGTLR